MRYHRALQFLLTTTLLIYIGSNLIENTSAQEKIESLGFTVSPSVVELYLEDGDEYIGEIGIQKKIEEPIPVSIEISKYLPYESNERTFTEELKDASEWLVLYEQATILEDTEKANVRYHISVPTGTKPGTYFTSIMFQPILPDYYFEDLSVHILPYIGGVIAVNIIDDNLDHSTPIIKDFRYRITQQADFDYFNTTVVNESDFYKSLQGEIVVSTISDEIIDKIEVDETRVLPKEERNIKVVAKEELSFGAYKAKIVLTDGEEIIEENETFFVFDTARDLPKVILIFVGIISVVYATFRLIRRHRKRKAKDNL